MPSEQRLPRPIHRSIVGDHPQQKQQHPSAAMMIGGPSTLLPPTPGWEQYLWLLAARQRQQHAFHGNVGSHSVPHYHPAPQSALFATTASSSSFHQNYAPAVPMPTQLGRLVTPPCIVNSNKNIVSGAKHDPPAAVVTPLTSRESPYLTTTKKKMKRKKTSILQHMLKLPVPTRQSLCIVSLTLERPSLTSPWGLRLTTEEGIRLFLTDVNLGAKTKWSHVAVATPENASLLCDENIYSNQPIQQCAAHAKMYADKLARAASQCTPSESEITLQRTHSRLFGGDWILAVDGHSMASHGSLTEVTQYLKHSTSVSLVVARHANVMVAAAAAAVSESSSADPSVDVASRISEVWKEIVPMSSSSTAKKAMPRALSSVKRPLLFTKPAPPPPPPIIYRNPLYTQEDGQHLPYDDDTIHDFARMYAPGDGTGVEFFVKPINNFQNWLAKRKTTWRRKYTLYKHPQEEKANKRRKSCHGSSGSTTTAINDDEDRASSTVAIDFWTPQGFSSFDDWLTSRVTQWKFSYSWNQKKRKRIQQECEEVVHISDDPLEFAHWLTVRKRQWRLQRRKRQRLRAEVAGEKEDATKQSPSSTDLLSQSASSGEVQQATEDKQPSESKLLNADNKELAFIDEIIEAEEAQRRRREMKKHAPIDIAKFFDASNGIPDDIVVRCFEYLEPTEHVKLLTIDRKTSLSLQKRENVWKSLCPSRWVLPRRPRKPWHELYCSRLKLEHEQRQKRWDDLLVKSAAILDSSDALSKIEKMVEDAEKSFGFDVNYVSGVVCERNSLLNLAVIHKRHKVTKWLVDTKKADIETNDRGNFTPLLNAAWEGDRALVRFFLQKGSNRNVKGTQHYSKAIAPPGFEGMTAEEWADERGHPDVAKLIRLGL